MIGFSMNKYETLSYKISARIARKKDIVFLREDFADLGGYDQVGRILRNLVRDGKIIKIGYGLYAKAKKSSITGEIIPVAPLPTLARAALERLGVEVAPSALERGYNAGKTTQVPTGRRIAINGRVSRKIGYGGAYISYESATTEELEMAAAGLARLPTEELLESFWEMEAPVVEMEDIVSAVRAERDFDIFP
jgi:hypothetical protein